MTYSRWLLLANTVSEGAAGLLLLISPQLVDQVEALNFLRGGSTSVLLLRMYGVAALGTAMLSGLALRGLSPKNELQLVFSVLTFFHLGIGAVLLVQVTALEPGIFHLLMGLGMAWALGRKV